MIGPNAHHQCMTDIFEGPTPDPVIIIEIGVADKSLRTSAMAGGAEVSKSGVAGGQRKPEQDGVGFDRCKALGSLQLGIQF